MSEDGFNAPVNCACCIHAPVEGVLNGRRRQVAHPSEVQLAAQDSHPNLHAGSGAHLRPMPVHALLVAPVNCFFHAICTLA